MSTARNVKTAKRGAIVDATLIAGEVAVAFFGAAAAIRNEVPFSDAKISSSWDGVARLALFGGALATASDAGRRTHNLYKNLKALSQ